MQQFSGVAQLVAQLQGRLQVQGQASHQAAAPAGGSSVSSMVQAYEARTTQQQVAANIVQTNREMVVHELQLKQGCPLGKASLGRPGSHELL